MSCKAALMKRVERKLGKMFVESGYMRTPDFDRRGEEKTAYKKGYEIRLIFEAKPQMREAKKLLAQAKIFPGKPFKKHSRWVLPIYGYHNWSLFAGWMEEMERLST